ncbi:MAG: ankyrin repeat domain-containing protein [Deltaproteobacteria bacterium]|nr:ankyrin repeat domain-containing protein [Deltaproteobacteria bacterium]
MTSHHFHFLFRRIFSAATRKGMILLALALTLGLSGCGGNRPVDLPVLGPIANGQTAKAKKMLETADANDQDAEGFTALMYAAQFGNNDLIQFLLSKGAKVNTANDKGMTALMLAVSNKHPETVKILLNAKADINQKNKDGGTALMLAATKDASLVKLLLERGAKLDQEDVDGWTALEFAAVNGQTEAAKLLVSKGIEPGRRDQFQMTPFMRALAANHPDTAEYFFQTAKPNVNERKANDGWTAIMVCAQSGAANSIRYLTKKGAKLDEQNPKGYAPLMIAIANKKWEAALALLESGADPKAGKTAADDMRPLQLAAYNGGADVIRALLKKGMKVDDPVLIENTKVTALMFAIISDANEERLATVKALVENGAAINLTLDGKTLLKQANDRNQSSVADYLRSKGAK